MSQTPHKYEDEDRFGESEEFNPENDLTVYNFGVI